MALTREEQLAAIERYYSAQVAGLPSDEEELAVAELLLEAARRGHVVNDTGTDTILIQSAAEIPVEADFMVDDEALQKQNLRRVLPIAGLIIIGLILIFVLYGGSDEQGSEDPTLPATAVTSVALSTETLTPLPSLTPTITPTPSPMPTAVPTETPTPLAPEEIEVKPEPVKLDAEAVIPVSLEIAGRYFPIVPTGLRGDGWAYVTDPAQVSWLAGSYVNVILGLPYDSELTASDPDNWDLLANTLAISDTLAVRNSVAAVNEYTVVDRRQVAAYEIEAFSQRQAGLTLVLLGGNGTSSPETHDQRLVIWAIPATGGKEVVAADNP